MIASLTQVLVLVLLPLLSPPLKAQQRTHPAFTVHTRTNGLDIRLSLPHSSYPRDALVKATVRVQNLTHTTMQLRGGAASCGTDNPRVEVLGTDGQVLYPPARPDLFRSPCPPIPATALPPGKTLSRAVYVVLRGAGVRAVVTLGNFNTVPVDVVGTTGSVRLTSEAAPVATVHVQSDKSVAADIRPAFRPYGPLLYVDSAQCPIPRGEARPTHLGWTPAVGRRVGSPCSPVEQWHGIAGWIGHPVVPFDYVP